MSNDDPTEGLEPGVLELAGQPLDEHDLAVLDEVAALLRAADPVPPDLVDRVRFALALDEMYAEVAQITRMPLDALAVRGEAAAGTRTETLTFSAERLTAMVTVTREGRDRLRLDGWVAPPGALTVRLRMQDQRREVEADESGRFVFEGLPEGFAQLSFHPAGTGDEAAVVTPLFQL